MKLPEKFLQNMKELLKDDYDKYIKSLDTKKYNGLRVNNLKISTNDFLDLVNLELEKVPWTKNGFYIEDKDYFTKNPYYNAGLYYIQEPSAMSVASLLEINEGDFVLDMCAAPGGKITEIGSKLNGTGYIVANDISPTRCKALVKNIEMMGITNATITSDNHKNLEKHFKNYFDKIILDVPCSGEGMFKSDSKAVFNWNEHTNNDYRQTQLDILNSAKNMLKKDGIISYSTCTFSVYENEIVVDEFLSENKDFRLLAINNEKYGFGGGLLSNPSNDDVNFSTRILPYMVKGEGHFICHLQKRSDVDLKASMNNSASKSFEKMIDMYKKFEKEFMNISIEGKFVMHEASLFVTHKDFIGTDKIRTLRSGFYLGDIRNDKFKPSQALASSLSISSFKNVINLKKDDINVSKYLKGETIIENCKDGYVLVCVDTFPLGFGFAKSNKVKNKFGKSMII